VMVSNRVLSSMKRSNVWNNFVDKGPIAECNICCSTSAGVLLDKVRSQSRFSELSLLVEKSVR